MSNRQRRSVETMALPLTDFEHFTRDKETKKRKDQAEWCKQWLMKRLDCAIKYNCQPIHAHTRSILTDPIGIVMSIRR